MVLTAKLLLSFFLLFPYSFAAVWLSSFNEAALAESLQGTSGLFFFAASFISLIALWGCTWLPKYRHLLIFFLYVAFACTVIFLYLGYPKSLGLVAISSPLIILSVVFIIKRRFMRVTT
jgi:hypothetical protein